MKNIQVIDGADNCSYDIYAATDDEFAAIFLGDTDIEFVEDLVLRLGEEEAGELLTPLWGRRVDKKRVNGIHGTLFFELKRKAVYYPTKKEAEAVALPT